MDKTIIKSKANLDFEQGRGTKLEVPNPSKAGSSPNFHQYGEFWEMCYPNKKTALFI